MTMKDMIARLKAINADQTRIIDEAEAAGRELTADEAKAFDDMDAEAAELEGKIKAAKSAAERRTRIRAVPSDTETGAVVKSLTTPPARTEQATGTAVQVRDPASVQVRDDMDAVTRVGMYIWTAAKQKHMPRHDAFKHLEDAGYAALADEGRAFRERSKALTTLAGGGGDNTIYIPMSTDFIAVLRNMSAFMVGQPVVVPMPLGQLDIPGGLAGSAGTYGAENANIGYTQMTTRKVSMKAKHLRAITAVSNYLIASSPLAIASIAGNDLAVGLAIGMDAAGLRGDGTGDNPSGILTLTNAAHKFNVAAGVSPALAAADLEAKKALGAMRTSNVPLVRLRWTMSGRVFTYLQFVRDGNGNLAYPGLSLPQPTWFGIPVTMSEQVPSNLGAGTNESEIYLTAFGQVLVGETRALQITASDTASYVNAGATHVSAFSLDETVIRGVMSHDFDMRHDKAAAILRAVQWGA